MTHFTIDNCRPYRRRKPFHKRHSAAIVNVLTLLVFGAAVLLAVVLAPEAIEHLQHDTMSGYGIDRAGDK